MRRTMEAAGNRGRVLTPGCDGMKAMRTASMLMMGRSRERVAQPRRNVKRPAARGSGRKKARLELMPSANCGKSASMNRVIPFFIRKAWRVCIGPGSRHRSARSTPLLSAKGQGPRADNRSCDVVHRDRQRLRRRVPGTPARSRSWRINLRPPLLAPVERSSSARWPVWRPRPPCACSSPRSVTRVRTGSHALGCRPSGASSVCCRSTSRCRSRCRC
jgi:hypothetical protein